MNKILDSLEKFWDVENIPKKSLQRADDDYFIDLKAGNLILVTIVTLVLIVSVMTVGSGLLWL